VGGNRNTDGVLVGENPVEKPTLVQYRRRCEYNIKVDLNLLPANVENMVSSE
jgi:hypothetical protein